MSNSDRIQLTCLRKEGISDDSVVTVSILREAFEEFEIKIEAKFQHYIGVIMEDNRRNTLLIIEHINMRFEAIDRYMKGNEEDKEKINYRVSRLESKVLLA